MEPDGCALLLTDTYDHENAVKNIIGGELKERIESFQGLVGVRPDSGDVVDVTSATTEWLMDAFGYTTNSKGYKVLPDFIRTVQGDGVRRETLPLVFMEMERRGLATDNAVFGMGGGLLQHCNRDTMEFGMKANAAKVNGEWRDIGKTPTGDAMKVSKKGRLALKYSDGEYTTVKRDEIAPEDNQLVPVFRNGQLLKKWDFAELKERSEAAVPEYYYSAYTSPLREAAKGGATPVGA
jgi:nicotinamide phosphoribosyltransferase